VRHWFRSGQSPVPDLRFLNRAVWGCGAFVEDYLLLVGVIVNLKPERILEVGTDTGLGAVVMAYASGLCASQAAVVTIDVDQSRGRSNLHLVKGIEKRIRFVEGHSDEVLRALAEEGERFDLVFIDGDHSYGQARNDWERSQELASTWVLHDTTQFEGLQRLVAEIRASRDYDLFQFVSAAGHRRRPPWTREQFITGMTVVQNRSNLSRLPGQAHQDEGGRLLAGHSDHRHPGLAQAH
jgi:hypothetical protein